MSKTLNDHQIEQARMMRERGESWRFIGRTFGVSEMTVMTKVDPVAAEKRRQYQANWRAAHGINSRGRATDRRLEVFEPRQHWSTVPSDTRNLTAMIMGDPLPGRSALDRRSVR